jgi:UDP-N-acetylglucosamine enolpyruvyl transferase
MADARPFHWEYEPPRVPRERYLVTGGVPLEGKVVVSGAKNAALKMLAAATLTGERCKFTNVPEIEDVRAMAETLADLGVVVDHPAPNTSEVSAGDIDWLFVPLEAAARMRASFMLLGPTTRRPRAGCAARRSASRSSRSWARRTRCSPRPWRTGTR